MNINITWEDVQLVAKQSPLFASQLENAALKRMLAEKNGQPVAHKEGNNGQVSADPKSVESLQPQPAE